MSDTLFEQLRPRLKAISARIVGSEAEAEDIVQDCFLKWHRAEQAALTTPAAWLTTVVQHHSIDHLRKRAREAEAANAALELQPATAPPTPEEEAQRRTELGQALARLLSELTPNERLTLVLHEVFECDHADIAATLGIRTETARQHLSRARRRLREQQERLTQEEKLSRELIQRFQASINNRDLPTMLTLLTVSRGPSANDARYTLAA